MPMPLPANPDCADLCAEALMTARRNTPGGLLRQAVSDIIRPIIEAEMNIKCAIAYESGTKDATPAVSHDAGKPKRAKGERAALFDAMCAACSIPSQDMTKIMKRSIAVALSAIMDAMPSLNPAEISVRAAQYKRRHPTWELTPMSLAKHWGSLATAESIHGRLDEPEGWKMHLETIFPVEENGATGDYLSKMPWPKIGRPHQERICRMMAEIKTGKIVEVVK